MITTLLPLLNVLWLLALRICCERCAQGFCHGQLKITPGKRTRHTIEVWRNANTAVAMFVVRTLLLLLDFLLPNVLVGQHLIYTKPHGWKDVRDRFEKRAGKYVHEPNLRFTHLHDIVENRRTAE